MSNEDWEELFSEKHRKVYWKNKNTGKSTWVNPLKATASHSESEAAVPPKSSPNPTDTTETAGHRQDEWTELFSEKKGKKYWKNNITGQSTWVQPSVIQTLTATASEVTGKEKEEGKEKEKGKEMDDWEELYSEKKGRKYWKNRITGKSTWDPPTSSNSASAPESKSTVHSDEWEELFSEKKGKKYWKNKTTGKSTWEDPFVRKTEETEISTKQTEVSTAEGTATDEWEELFSQKKGKKYWRNKNSGAQTWTNPHEGKADELKQPEMPVSASVSVSFADDEWEELYSQKKDKKYWRNKKTGKSTWSNPIEEKVHEVADGQRTASNPLMTATTEEPSAAPSTANGDESTSEWEELFSTKKGKKYWRNKVTGKSSWTPPPLSSNANPSSNSVPTAPLALNVATTSISSIAEPASVTSESSPHKVLSNTASSKVLPVEIEASNSSIQKHKKYSLRSCCSERVPSADGENLYRVFFELRFDTDHCELELKKFADNEQTTTTTMTTASSSEGKTLLSNLTTLKTINLRDVKFIICNEVNCLQIFL